MGKKDYHFKILIVLSFIFLISLATAQDCAPEGFMGRFQKDTNVTITETCPTCSFINITIKDPDSEIIISNKGMTNANGIFSYTNDTISTKEGVYIVEGYSNLTLPLKACYRITNAEIDITTSEAIIYILLAGFALLTLIFALWGSIALPVKNARNEEGRIVSVSSLKYFKVGLMFLSYALVVWLTNLMLSLSNNLVTLTQYNGFFEMLFIILRALIWPVFVIMIITFFMMGAKDLQLTKLLDRGINPRG